jgi:hypothetical protein
LGEGDLGAREIERHSFGGRAIVFHGFSLSALSFDPSCERNGVGIVNIVCESEKSCIVLGIETEFVVIRKGHSKARVGPDSVKSGLCKLSVDSYGLVGHLRELPFL